MKDWIIWRGLTLWINLVLRAIFALELSIGPLGLEREMQIHEFPAPGPSETAASSQAGEEVKVWFWDRKTFSLRPENLIFPDFLRKHDRVIWVEEE